MKEYSGFSAKTVLLIASLMVLVSCKDTWNEHYSYKADSNFPVDKIDITLEGVEGYDKFYAALETTYLYDRDGKRYKDNQNFLDLLHQDQFITVWAPSNESISDSLWSIYTDPNKSDSINYEVGERFLKNHIARFKHTISSVDTTKVFMMNGKPVVSTPTTIGDDGHYHGNDKNIRCLNGILHFLDGNIAYKPNIYEYITTTSEYREILGKWFKSYTIAEIDQEKSVASGKDENGEKIWIDAVLIESSILLKKYGFINSEDSTYAMLLPTPDLWKAEYNRIKDYYLYSEAKLDNDSLQKFYTGSAMLTDMVINMNQKVQRDLPDSVYTTLYDYSGNENRRDKRPYHVFSYPYDKVNGVFGSALDSIECSNGKIYVINKWPFVDTLSFLRNIKFEAENYRNLPSFFTMYQRTINTVAGKKLDNSIRIMRIFQEKNYWGAGSGASFSIPGNLKGKYAVKLVMLPNQEENNKPILFHPVIKYNNITLFDSMKIVWEYYTNIATGELDSTMASEEFVLANSPDKIDTLLLSEVDIPYCSYDMPSSPLTVTLYSRVNENNTDTYSAELWLDGIILEPVVE